MDKLIMVEIYGGKDERWKGWHNLIITNGNKEEDQPIAGPIDPGLSERILEYINQPNQ